MNGEVVNISRQQNYSLDIWEHIYDPNQLGELTV
jgi:hypothetical protein